MPLSRMSGAWRPLPPSAWALAGAALLAACAEAPPELPPVSLAEYTAEHSEWRADRQERLVTPPGGPVLWIGLWELDQGPTDFGSDPDLPIVLPEVDAPPLSGKLVRTGQEVRLEPAAGVELGVGEDSSPVAGPLDLAHDRMDEPTYLSLGSLGLRIHAEPGTDRLWLRVWDTDRPERETFRLPEAFPVDPDWRVAARYEPYPEPRPLPVLDVTDGMLEFEAPGELHFEVDGEEHSLIAVAGPSSSSFFVMMWDETALTETYEAGRYLRVPLPEGEGWTLDRAGWTTIDFNRAYNAPCVFTAFSVCSLPPPENRMAVAITAGEKRRSDK